MTTLACPNCSGTHLAFDFDAVVTVNVKDGELQGVSVGGALGDLPYQLLCRDCDHEVLSRTFKPQENDPAGAAIITPMTEQVDKLLQDAPQVTHISTPWQSTLFSQLEGGFAFYDTHVICTNCWCQTENEYGITQDAAHQPCTSIHGSAHAPQRVRL